MFLKKQKLFYLLSVVFIFTFFVLFFFLFINKEPVKITKEDVANSPVYEKFEGYYAPPIFSFHHISSVPVGVSKNIVSLYIEPEKFEKILAGLQESGYKTVFVSEIVELLEKGEKPPHDWLAITFDDGDIDFYNNAFPLLKKYNMKSSLYIMTGVHGKNYMTADEIKEANASGLVEIGSHTIFHPDLTKISEDRLTDELGESKKYLEDLLGKNISGICYPYGSYNEKVKEVARQADYKYGLSYNNRPKDDITDLFEINRFGVWPGMNIIKFAENLQ